LNRSSKSRVERSDQTNLVGIDLFAGAGGMSLGAEMAGVKTLLAVEQCPHAAATYQLNFPHTKVHVGDIRKVRELPPKPRHAPTVVFGGPPCQGFSTSNQRTRNADNPNNWLFEEFIRVVKLWNPDWVVMENVKGIVETDGGRFLEATLTRLKKAGYTAEYKVLNAVDYGVPQRRSRVFIVASHHGTELKFPKPTLNTPVTLASALADLPLLENGAQWDELPYRSRATSEFARSLRNSDQTVTGNLVTRNAKHILERYRYVPQGGNWESIPARLMKNYSCREKCHTGIYRRLDSSKPADVIGNFRKNMLIHPYEDRGLSVREAARIQSVPDRFRFCGSIGFQQQQVGNMVPPKLSEAIFNAVGGH
jgi:DNA (cytosine-5)-methyltransferase 1